MEEKQFKQFLNYNKKILEIKKSTPYTSIGDLYQKKLVQSFFNLDNKFLNKPYALVIQKIFQANHSQEFLEEKLTKHKKLDLVQKSMWLINHNLVSPFKILTFLVDKNKSFSSVKKDDLTKALSKCGIKQVENLMIQSMGQHDQEEIFKLGLKRLSSVRSLNKIINHVLQMPAMEASVLLRYIELNKDHFKTPKSNSKILDKFKAFVKNHLEDILYHSHLDKIKSIQQKRVNLTPQNQFFLLKVEKSLKNIYNIEQKNIFHHFIGNIVGQKRKIKI